MTSAFDLPTSNTSSCDTVGVTGRSNAKPAIYEMRAKQDV
jgi:hypothetical protein